MKKLSEFLLFGKRHLYEISSQLRQGDRDRYPKPGIRCFYLDNSDTGMHGVNHEQQKYGETTEEDFLKREHLQASINPESNPGIVVIDGQNITDLFLPHRCDSRFEIELVPGSFQQRVDNCDRNL